MSDTVKLIIEIPKPMYENVQNGTYCGTLYKELKNGIPLDDVKAEITALRYGSDTYKYAIDDVLDILDNIGKAEHNDGLICSECECKEECDGIEYMSKDQCEKKRGWQ